MMVLRTGATEEEIGAKRQPEAKSQRHGGDTAFSFLFFVIAFPAGLIVGAFIGAAVGREDIRKEAVKVGHATWEPDDSGSPVFKWLDNGGQ